MNGLVYKIKDTTYLSLINIETDNVTDGIPISEGVYKDSLKKNEISFCVVSVFDGTEEIKIENVDYFVNEVASENSENLFYKIKDILVFSMDFFTIEEICEKGDFIEVTKDIINNMKKRSN
jgi:hypothetical protein